MMKDPLLQKMMMDSKQFINDPAFNEVLMYKIMKQEEKKFILKKGIYYSIPIVCLLLLMFVFARPIATGINTITVQLTPDNILNFFKGITGYLQIAVVLFLVAVVPKLIPAKITKRSV